MVRIFCISGFSLFFHFCLSAQVGINTSSPNPAAVLDLTSQNKGFLPPRMTMQERNSIQSPVPAGLVVWCTNCGISGQLQVYNGTMWTDLTGTPAADAFVCGTSTVTFNYNGNPVTYGTVQGTGGRCWLDRNLGASQVATSSMDEASYGDLLQWGRNTNGHQLRTSANTSSLATTDAGGYGEFILAPNNPFDWRTPQNGLLWQGFNAINNPCPTGYRIPTEAEFETERQSWSINNSSGAFTSTLKLPAAGYRQHNNASVVDAGSGGFYWTSTSDGILSKSLNFDGSIAEFNNFNRANGKSIRCIKDEQGSINLLNCSAATVTGPVSVHVAVSNVSVQIPYTGGNGGSHAGQVVQSTGITGLTATLLPGIFAQGSGTLTYTISGSTSSFGLAYFTLNIGGQTCNISLNVLSPCGTASTLTFTYNGNTVTYGLVVGPSGRCWMDRNLGASQVATSSSDAAAFGDLFQWGRGPDLHQLRTSGTLNEQSATDTPGHPFFITGFADWRNPPGTGGWPVNNNPCPPGFNIPSPSEWTTERSAGGWTSTGSAISSPLKLPATGRRTSNGTIETGTFRYWTGSSGGQGGATAGSLSVPFTSVESRATGIPVRCIKDL